MREIKESWFAPRRRLEKALFDETALSRITELIACDPMPVNALGSFGESLFALALSAGRLDVCSYLLKCGADANRENIRGDTPLAAYGQVINGAQILQAIDLGARIERDSRRKPVEPDQERIAILSELAAHMIGNFWNNRIELLSIVSRQGVSLIEANPGDEASPIWWAAATGDREVFNRIIEIEGGIGDANQTGRHDAPLLSAAVSGGDRSIIEQVIEAGGRDAADAFIGRTSFMLACASDDLEVMAMVGDAGGEVTAGDEYGENALMYAIEAKARTVAPFMVEHHIGVWHRDHDGASTLAKAIEEGWFELAQALENVGVPVAETDAAGKPNLLRAVKADNKPMYEWVCDRYRRSFGSLPFHEWVPDTGRLLRTAAFLEDTDILEDLLERGAQIDGRNSNGETALYRVAGRPAHNDSAEILLEWGADPCAETGEGETPISRAVRKGNLWFVEIAVDEYGVSPDFCDGEGAPLICTAAGEGEDHMVELLLALGADRNPADMRGRPLEEYQDQATEFEGRIRLYD